jgi:hypothetical protein
MKTTKLILSITLVALTISTFGRVESNNLDNEITIESWMASPFEADAVENNLTLENWMTSPFEAVSLENDVALENWMISPFETGVEQLNLECWMVTPFDVEALVAAI